MYLYTRIHTQNMKDTIPFGELSQMKQRFARGELYPDACDDIIGDSLLIWATRMKNLGMVKLLVEHKCNVNATSLDGHTALDIAIENENLGIFRILTRNGAVTYAEKKRALDDTYDDTYDE